MPKQRKSFCFLIMDVPPSLFPAEKFSACLHEWQSATDYHLLAATAAYKDCLALLEEEPILAGSVPIQDNSLQQLRATLTSTGRFIRHQACAAFKAKSDHRLCPSVPHAASIAISSPFAGAIPGQSSIAPSTTSASLAHCINIGSFDPGRIGLSNINSCYN